MAKKKAKKMQLRWVIGTEYTITGAAGGERTMTLTAKGKTRKDREILIFEPRRKAKKTN